MHLKRILYISIVCLLSLLSVNAKEKIVLVANVGYGYNSTWKSFGDISAIGHFSAAENFRFTVGADYKIHRQTTLKGSGRVTFPFTKVSLFLENSYLYSASFNSNFQQANAALCLGVETKHFIGSIGWFGRWMAPFCPIDGNVSSSIFEPLNLAYAFEGRIFPKENNWNLSLEISNVGEFEFERVTSPIVTLNGIAVVVKNLSVQGALIVKPAGFGHLTANAYQIQVQMGVTYVW